MRTRAATAQLIRTQLAFSGDAALRRHIWTDVRTAYSETLQQRPAGTHAFGAVVSHKFAMLAAAAVLVLGLLILSKHMVFQGSASRPESPPMMVTAHDPNASKVTVPQILPGRELAEARQLFERKDLAGLVRLLDDARPETRIQAAEYLGQIGDDSVLPALQGLAARWQGPAQDNPFRKAMQAIQGRQMKPGPQPPAGEREPNRAAGKPTDEVKTGTTGAAKPRQMTGTVLDKETGKPIAGAQVGVRSGARSVSDAEGRFSLVQTGPSSGVVYLYASAPGYATGVSAAQVRQGADVQEVVLALGPGSRLAVMVVDPNGSPVPGAKLRLVGLEALEWDLTTDANGQFAFEGLDPTARFYNLEVMHPGYPFLLTQIPPPATGQTLHQKVMLKPGVVVFGLVTDPNGRPVVGATIGNTFSGVTWNGIKVKTDEQGMYRLGPVDNGELILWATHERFRPFVQHASLSAQDTQRRIDIRMDVGQVLKGRVVDDSGNPVPQATVKMSRYNELIQPVDVDHPCDADGRFTIPNAPGDGVLGLSVKGPGIIATNHKVDFSQAECVIAIPRLGRIYGKVLDAATGAPVPRFKVKMSRGRVAATSGGYATTWAQEGHDFDSPDGLFDTSVAAALPVGGAYRITVQAEGYDPVTIDPVVAQPIGDRPTRTEFRLQPVTAYAGRVLATDGRPLAGATVVFFSTEEASHNPIGRWPNTATSNTGVYAIAGLRSDPQCLMVSAPGFGLRVFVMADLLAAPGRLSDITLEPAASLLGRVVDERGQAVVNAQVRAQPNLEHIRNIVREIPFLGPTTQTNEEGRYQLSDLPTGKVSIYVYVPSGHRDIGHSIVDLKPGEAATLDFIDQGGPAGSPSVPSGTR